MKPIRVAHIITGLKTGGAEMMLYRLIQQHKRDGIHSIVFSLLANGDLKPLIQAEGVEVIDLDFPRGRINLIGFFRLVREIRKWNPDVIQCWMYHANIVGEIAARLAGNFPVLWGIHNTTLDKKSSSRKTICVMRLGGILSFLPNQIITCSEVARDVHIPQLYRREKFKIIPNGFDTDLFQSNERKRKKLCTELRIKPDAKLIGMIGRYDPQKDFSTFIQAAAILSREMKNVHFIMCGQNVDKKNEELTAMIEQAGIVDKVHLLGRRSDITYILQGIDILISSSAYGEAFPGIIGEAMACGVPCVATDVGDARYLIGETGIVVQTKQPESIVQAVMELFSLSPNMWKEKQKTARQRIMDHFSLLMVANLYAEVFEANRRK